MKNKTFIFALLLFVVASCNEGNYSITGKSYEVLEPKVYNELQKKFSEIGDFEQGTAIVQDRGLFGLINGKGKLIVECMYDSILPIRNNNRVVSLNGKYGILNITGNLIVDCIYDDYRVAYKDNYFPFSINGKWGFVSENNEVLIQFKYDAIEYITDSTFVGKINSKQGLFDYNENAILQPIYDVIGYNVIENFSYVRIGDKYGYVNSHNKLITKCEWGFTLPENGYLILRKSIPGKLGYNEKELAINVETGEIVIPMEYDNIDDYSDGLFCVRKDDKYGYLNNKNEVVIPLKFADAMSFSEGLAMVAIEDGIFYSIGGPLPRRTYGFIDKTGTFVIHPKFGDPLFNDGSKKFSEGLCAVGVKSSKYYWAQKFGYIDITGKYVIEPIFTKAGDFINGIAVVERGNKYGGINKRGEIIIDIKYDECEYRRPSDTCLVFINDGKKYFYQFDGTPISQ